MKETTIPGGIHPPWQQSIDGRSPFLDIHTPHDPENTQNGNPGSKCEYFPERRIFMTGLNGAFLCTFFRISVD